MTSSAITSGFLPFKFQDIKRVDITRLYSGKTYKFNHGILYKAWKATKNLVSAPYDFVRDFNLIDWTIDLVNGKSVVDIGKDIGSSAKKLALATLDIISVATLLSGAIELGAASIFLFEDIGVWKSAKSNSVTNTYIEVHSIILDYDMGYSSNNTSTFQCLRTKAYLDYDSGSIENVTVSPFQSIPTPIGTACAYRNSSGKLLLATKLTYKGPNKDSKDDGFRTSPGFDEVDVIKTNEFLRSMLGDGKDKTADDFLNMLDTLSDSLLTQDNLTAIPNTVENYTDKHVITNSNTANVATIKINANRSRTISSAETTDINTLIRY